ncbi:MAG: DUF1573 domain-containing protein [Planctomycetes bacterium]|nr:DUF1573 domain-containing protein [Planctomycetota bacterium]
MGTSRWILRFAGTLLLAAAALKAWGLEPMARLGVLSTAEAQLTIIALELFLGLWLWIGAGRANALGPWLLAVLTFAIFACVTFYLGWVGQSSCGCLGRYSPNPWYAFGLDVCVLAGLVMGCPDWKLLRNHPRTLLSNTKFPAPCGLIAVLLSGAISGLAWGSFGSVGAALAHFRGERLSIHPRLVDAGAAPSGDGREVRIALTNWTEQPINLIGGTSDCACTVLGDLPVTIPAGETATVAVNLHFSGRPGLFTRQAAFLIDDQGFKAISFTITGRILERTENSDEAGGAP